MCANEQLVVPFTCTLAELVTPIVRKYTYQAHRHYLGISKKHPLGAWQDEEKFIRIMLHANADSSRVRTISV